MKGDAKKSRAKRDKTKPPRRSARLNAPSSAPATQPSSPSQEPVTIDQCSSHAKSAWGKFVQGRIANQKDQNYTRAMVVEHMINPFLIPALQNNLPGYGGVIALTWNKDKTMCTISVNMSPLLDETLGGAEQIKESAKRNHETVSSASTAVNKLEKALKTLIKGYSSMDFQFKLLWGARIEYLGR